MWDFFFFSSIRGNTDSSTVSGAGRCVKETAPAVDKERELERQIASLCRAVAARIASGETVTPAMTPASVNAVLGPPRFLHDENLDTARPGIGFPPQSTLLARHTGRTHHADRPPPHHHEGTGAHGTRGGKH